jgi:hypothetical protein
MYISYNRNFIFFNLKKQKLKVHSFVISNKKYQNNRSTLEITGFKKDNVSIISNI